ncbi:MAG TPA: FAD-dependent oxidoreductase [Polyangiaceae bacterium]|jgi:oxygen-dependent protoporphyrinogen oxidase
MRVAIIGGGLTGLTVAYRRASLGDRVTLYEASARLGGQLSTERSDGFVVEHGAEGFVARSEAVARLATDLGIADRLVEQLVHRSYRFDGASLLELAPGEAARLLGFQVPSDELGRGIRSFIGGMADLPDALVDALEDRVDLRLSSAAQRIDSSAGKPRVSFAGGDSERYDAIVVATGAVIAGELLVNAFGSHAAALREATCASSTTVTLAYPRAAIAHPLDATGFISIPEPVFGARAATFVSAKLPARAPAERALFRVFFRPTEDELATETDANWVTRAHAALRASLGVEAEPLRSWVSRWPQALPVLDAAHRARVSELESALAGSQIRLAGSAFHGSGIDAAVRSAEQAAAALS